MSGLEIAGIVIGIVTALFLGGNLYFISMNFRQQRKMDTLNYFSKITPKIAEFSEWLDDKSCNEPNWLNKIIDDKPLSSKQRDYTDKIQSYLSEIELLSIAMLKEKILEPVFIKDFEKHFLYQWSEMETYRNWMRKKNENSKAWTEMENLVNYLKKCNENNNKRTWTYMKNLVKNVNPRR